MQIFQNFWRPISVLGLSCALVSPTLALQPYDTQDGATTVARIPQREPARIKVDGGAIVDVFGDIATKDNPGGRLRVEPDKERGEIYVRLVDVSDSRPIDLFVKSAQGTYTLVLQPVDIPADTIVLKDRSAPPRATLGLYRAKPERHQSKLKAMLLAMQAKELPAEVRVADTPRVVPLWQEAHFVLQRTFEARDLIGERYLLTNVSKAPMVLAEPEFYRPGVLAVAVEQSNLSPNEATTVYVIREAQQ